MNRQQAHDRVPELIDDIDESAKVGCWHYGKVEMHKHIDMFYDDFESRICGNCAFGGDRQYCNNPSSFCVQSTIESTDGCNQFERTE